MDCEDLQRLAREGAPLDKQREAITQILSERGLDDVVVEEIVAQAKDGIGLVEQETGDGNSRLGGDPLLPEGEEWPKDPKGMPLAFIAVLDLDELPDLEPLPTSGKLLVFWDQQFHDLDHMDFVVSTRVFHVEADAPARKHDPPDPDEAYDVIPLSGYVMPILGSVDDSDVEEPDFDEFFDAVEEVTGAYDHSLLGASHDVQGPVLEETTYWFDNAYPETRERFTEEERSGEGWILLAQISSTGDLMFGDVGALYLCMLEADLRERRFDRVMGIMQSH
jgi:uncharacterized protein YwqG